MNISLKKTCQWFFAITFGLPLCAYIALIIINLGEQDLSASSSDKYDNIKQWGDNVGDDNAYIYALGFTSATPMIKGKELARLIIANDTDWPQMVNEQAKDKNITVTDSDELRQICFRRDNKLCKADRKRQIYYYNSSKAKQLVHDNKELIANYQQLITLPTWQEVAIDTNINIYYGQMLSAQRLYLMTVLQKINTVEVQTTKNLLEMDIRFWRMILSETHHLITKTIAKAAIERHFVSVQQALLTRTVNEKLALVPDSWLQQISKAERDFTKPLIGEWAYQQNLHKNIEFYEDEELLVNITSMALSPLFKMNNSLNLSSQYYDIFAQYSLLKYTTMENAVSHLEVEIQQQQQCQFKYDALGFLYNPIGKLILCFQQPNLAGYVIKIADLEAIRRLTLLSFELDVEQYSAEELKAVVTNSKYNNPYTELPFNYDPDAKTLNFIGFQSDEFTSDRVIIAL
ncbi:hypothetical protein AADZ86_02385 [Colwelliaceae bacterium BS250]